MKMMRPKTKKGSRFFDELIKNSGENFLETELEVNIRRRIQLLIRDIAFGNVDKTKYGKYFNERLCTILYDEVYRRYQENFVIYDALRLYSKDNIGNDVVTRCLKGASDRQMAYGILLENVGFLCASGGNLSYIDIAAVKLKDYKFSF